MLPVMVLSVASYTQVSTIVGDAFKAHSSPVAICKWGAVAQSVERATPGEEVLDLIPAVAARSLLIGSMSL